MTLLITSLDDKSSDRFLRHRQREWSILLPWFRRVRTALYYLDTWRFGRYIDQTYERDLGWVNWHERKWQIQQEYKRMIEDQGQVLLSIYVKRVAKSDWHMVDYLLWLDWTWQLYLKNINRDDFEDEGFIRFSQSNFIFDEELTETWKIK